MFNKDKIIKALLENAFLSLYEYHRHSSTKAADTADDADEAARKIFIPDGSDTNGTMQRLRDEYFMPYDKRRYERLVQRMAE